MTTNTLEYGGVEKDFPSWGVVMNLPFQLSSQAEDLVHVLTTDGFDAAFKWDWDAKVTIRLGRSGSGTSWSGGSVWFQGYVAKPGRIADGPRQNHRYTLVGPWNRLERCQFQQTRKTFVGYTPAGDPSGVPVMQTILSSEYTIGEDINEELIDSGEVIREVLTWANECWNPTKRGASSGRNDNQDILKIGIIGVAAPICRQPMRDRKVAEIIKEMLRCSQDAIAWFDYSTTPPTFNIRRLPDLTAVGLNVSVDRFRRLELEPRYDRQIPGVIVRYKKNREQDGGIWVDFQVDKYPTTLNEYDPDASVHTIELVGSSKTTVQASIFTAPVRAAAGSSPSDATRLAWWKAHDTALADTTIVAASLQVANISITDEAGAAVNLSTYPNELQQGQVADWMQSSGNSLLTKTVTVKGEVSYTKQKSGTTADFEKVTLKPVHLRITLTNGTTGTYNAVTHNDPGESAPGWVGPGPDTFSNGLAQAFYEGFADLQFEGSPTLVGDEINGEVTLGKKLTITTPGNVFQNILIQGVRGELCSGTITPQLGPPGHLGLTDMIEMLRVNRYRIIYNLPSNRSTGSAGGAVGVTLGAQTPKENTISGATERQLHTVAYAQTDAKGGTTFVQFDARNEKIILHRVDNSGASRSDCASMEIASSDLLDEDSGEYQAMRVRRIHYTDADTGDKKRVLCLVSAPVDDDDSDVIGNTDDDPRLGGGGGGINWRGLWVEDYTYKRGDVVRVREDGPAAKGVWILVAPTATGADQAPQWPEPADVDPEEDNFWENITLGPREQVVCAADGTKATSDVNMSEPQE